MITLPANWCPPMWLTSVAVGLAVGGRCLLNCSSRIGPQIPQRLSRSMCPQMRTIGWEMGLLLNSEEIDLEVDFVMSPCLLELFRVSNDGGSVLSLAGMRNSRAKARTPVLVIGIPCTS